MGNVENPSSTSLSENFDPHVSAKILRFAKQNLFVGQDTCYARVWRSKFSCRLVSGGVSALPMFFFKIFEKFRDSLKCGISMRDGGVSKGPFASLNLGLDVSDKKENVFENYRRFCDELGIDIGKLCLAYQEHTDKILSIRENLKIGFNNPFKGIDGFITDIVGVPLMVRFADCQGVFMFDPIRRVVAAVHSGWRGNVQNIIGKAVMKMRDEFGCDIVDVLVGVSPSLGPCCAEFSDPLNELPEFMHKYVNDGSHVDLWRCSFDQLTESGVLAENIEIARRCTVCENDKFFSYRGGNKETGHMGGVVCLI